MANGYRKLGRTADQRRAVLRDLVTDLIINERIETTLMKAKEVSSMADKMVTLGKKGTLEARKDAGAFVRYEAAGENQNAVQKLFAEIAPRYANREGGYTRVLKVGPRRGDGAEMAIVEFVK